MKAMTDQYCAERQGSDGIVRISELLYLVVPSKHESNIHFVEMRNL
jgi:hypothetical protein